MPLNFYQLYGLLKENTVSQEIKSLRQKDPSIGETLSELKKELKAAFLHLTIHDKSLDALSKWIILSLKKSSAPISERMLRYVVINLKNDFGDFLSYSLGADGNFNPSLLNKFNNPIFKYEDLKGLSDQYHEDLEKGNIQIPGAVGETILSFPDGYKWVDLGRGYCSKEGKAGKHCGNASPRMGDTILSLRDKNNFVYLTFILNNGILEERKAKANTKPKEKYHHYILELLKLPMIKGLGEGRYLPQNDFQLSDLSADKIEDLLKVKPEMEQFYYLSMLLNGKEPPKEALVKLINNSNSEIDKQISEKTNNSEILILLYNKYKEFDLFDGNIMPVRSDRLTTIIDIITNIANNPNTDKSIIEELFKKYYLPKNAPERRNWNYTPGWEIIASILSNPKVPKELIKKIIEEDDKTDLSYVVSINPGVSGEVLSDMFYKGRDSVLSNPNIPEEILRTVVNSERLGPMQNTQKDRLALVASNPNCPSDILDKLSTDVSYTVKQMVAHNKNTKIETLKKMANDTSKDINGRTISDLVKDKRLLQSLMDRFNNL